MNKRCRICGVSLNTENWYPSNRKNHNNICKKDSLKKSKQYYGENTERMNEVMRKWRQENPEKQRQITKRWIEENRERYNKIKRLWTKTNLKRHTVYVGVVNCPKCGRHGYMHRFFYTNETLGTRYPDGVTVEHRDEHNKYESICYIRKDLL